MQRESLHGVQARKRHREGVIELSLPHSRIEPDPDVDWVWEDGDLHGRTADGAVGVSVGSGSAQWSWGAYTVFAEELEDQVWLTFDKTETPFGAPADLDAGGVEVCLPWMGAAPSAARALFSPATRERVGVVAGERIPDRVFDVAAEGARIFEQSHRSDFGLRSDTDRGGG